MITDCPSGCPGFEVLFPPRGTTVSNSRIAAERGRENGCGNSESRVSQRLNSDKTLSKGGECWQDQLTSVAPRVPEVDQPRQAACRPTHFLRGVDNVMLSDVAVCHIRLHVEVH